MSKTSQTRNKKKQNYHHGDLRQSIIEATVNHVRNHGAASFSLRDASKAAGVSSGAAYRHFDNRQALLNEVVILGLKKLAETTISETADMEGMDKVIACGMAYIKFAREEPHLFSLMFSSEGTEGRQLAFERLPNEFSLENTADQLRSAIFSASGVKPDEATFMHAWGVVHGIAALEASSVRQCTPEETKEVLSKFCLTL